MRESDNAVPESGAALRWRRLGGALTLLCICVVSPALAGQVPEVDVSVSISADPDPTAPGFPLSYFIAVRNNDPESTAPSVTVENLLSDSVTFTGTTCPERRGKQAGRETVTCVLFNIPPNTTRFYTDRVTVNPGAVDPIVNTVRALYDNDPDPRNNTVTREVSVTTSEFIAVDDFATTRPDEPVLIDVLANDSGVRIEFWFHPISEPPSHGTASVVGGEVEGGEVERLKIEYEPNAGFVGVDTFKYQIAGPGSDGPESEATVTIIVKPLSPNERSVGEALITVCADEGTTGDLAQRCAELSELSDQELRVALREIAPEKLPSQGNTMIEASYTEMRRVRTRLGALRAGVRGVSVSGLSIGINGQTVPVGRLASGFVGNAARAMPASTMFHRPAQPGVASLALDEPSAGIGSHNPPFAPAANVTSNDPGNGSETDRSIGKWRRLGLFVNGRYDFGDRISTVNETGYDFTTAGLSAGVDYRFSNRVVAGGALHYLDSDSDFAGSGGKLETKTLGVSLYGNYYPARMAYFDWIVSYGRPDFDVTRNIAYSGFSTEAQGSTKGSLRAISVSGGVNRPSKRWNLSPYIRLDYLSVDIDGYTETGGGGLALVIQDQDVESFRSALAGNFNRPVSMKWGVLIPGVRVEWEHEFKNDARFITSAFADNPISPFSIVTDSPDRDYFNIGVNLAATFRKGKSAFLDYETLVEQEFLTRHLFTVGFRAEF